MNAISHLVRFGLVACTAVLMISCGGSAPDTANVPAVVDDAPDESGAADVGPAAPINIDDAPADPLADLIGRVERGEWTLEEGLIYHLRALAGEIEIDRPDSGAAPIEVGDLIVIARSYLQDGSDEDAKTEIRRLLNGVDISTEDLLEYATPVDPANPGAGLDFRRSLPEAILEAIVPSAVAQEPAGCREWWVGGVRDDVQPPGICFGVEEWVHRGNTHRIFFPLPWARDANPNYAFVGHARRAINRSLDTYVEEMGLTLKSVNMHFLEGASEDGFLAAMWPDGESFTSQSDCRVKAYASSYVPNPGSRYASGGIGNDIGNFQQVVAHEVFHCMQLWNLSSQMYGAAGLGVLERGAFEVVRKWWSEGTAEYFSNVVYACNQLEWLHVDEFNERAPENAIFRMTYENTTVFQHLGNALGNSGVFDILRAMPGQGSIAFQIAAADRTALADEFHPFGRRYIENDVQDSCGTGPGGSEYLPTLARLDELPIFGGIEHELESPSYKLNMKKFVYMPGDWQLEYVPAGADPEDAYENLQLGGWHEPPTTVNATCSEASGNLLVTTTRASGVLQYTIRETGPPSPEFQLDRCLVGSWQATQDSATQIAQWVAANPLTNPNVETELAEVSGTIVGSIEAGGRASGSMLDFSQRYLSTINIGSTTINNATTVTTNGTSTGRYSADGTLMTVWAVCTESSARATVEANGNVISDMEIDLQAVAGGGAGIPGIENVYADLGGPKPEVIGTAATTTEAPTQWEFKYRCTNDTLEIDPPSGVSSSIGERPPWVFRKR